MFSVERFEKNGLPLPHYDTEGAARAGRMGLVLAGCNGRTNIHSIPVDRPRPEGFLTRTVSTAVECVQDRLKVVDRARAEEEAGLRGDRSTARGRTARDENTVLELEEHVKKGTLREVRDISERQSSRPLSNIASINSFTTCFTLRST